MGVGRENFTNSESMGCDYDTVVVGAGVVGLAVAAELAERGDALLLLERHDGIGRETSSRNSEVIHAGIYYPPGSLKARLCLRGRELLYERCRRHDLPQARCGKLIVGREAERSALETIADRARACGVTDLLCLEAGEVARLEPHIGAGPALLSPSTGIVDVHALMRHHLARCQAAGADVVFRAECVGADAGVGGYRLELRTAGGGRETVSARRVVNAAGLRADRVAAAFGIDIDAAGYRLQFAKGDYFSVHERHRGKVQRLIYPTPAASGHLGVHITLDLSGALRLGPDLEYVPAREEFSYDVDPAKAAQFARRCAGLFPFIEECDLSPGTSGIRPRLVGPGAAAGDFVIRHEVERGLPGLVNLLAIESPGLTAAEAIAQEVADLLRGV